MLSYTVEAAIESGVFDVVVVSTEDHDIATVAARAGAHVHPRPASLAGDLVSATDVCLDAHNSLRSSLGDRDAIVCLQPTSPLRTADDITASWSRFLESRADFLVSVTAIDPHYFHWALREDGPWWRLWFGQEYLLERPLLPPVFRPNGAIKMGRIEPTARLRHFFGPRLTIYEMEETHSVHVATKLDLLLAEALLTQAGPENNVNGA